MNFEAARAQMLGQQIRAWEVLDDRVLRAIADTPRERFVPSDYRDLAFADTEIPIGHGQFMPAPKIEGRILQALEIERVDEVLEIGTGTGYLTACLARLGRHVATVDIVPDFVASARARLAELEIANVEAEPADALAMDVPAGRFDAIAVTGSLPELDEHFIRMLRPGGRLFVVVGRAPAMEARLVTMHADGAWTTESLFETVLTPLINAERPEPFVL
jgi:protein-L-isoaspartate(D-aspartate) O-methyltransferase